MIINICRWKFAEISQFHLKHPGTTLRQPVKCKHNGDPEEETKTVQEDF